ncbi:MAG TPA: aminotransferase, partial [Planctomycetaceae bacterium]|nr:aminotransferase [Planctomycetaceae bacterium]
MPLPPAPHADWRSQFPVRPGVTYLNHGSFGPSPNSVLASRHEWSHRLESEPMDFFLRQMEDHLDTARGGLGRFVGTAGRHLAFVDNATFAMNVVAEGFPLEAGDEVLANDHEYGAVLRIWRKRCQETGARLVVSSLPKRFQSADEVVASLFAQATSQTRLIVVSHITSPTAVVLPVEAICREARSRGIAVCIDGPHAPAAVPVAIDRLGCDFYCASLHKWLSAPFGSGFLYVHPRWQQRMEPTIVSWGNSLSGRPGSWLDPYNWLGTRDPAAFLAVPAAIEYLQT